MVSAQAPSDLPPSCRLIPIAPHGNREPVQLRAVVQRAEQGAGHARLVLLNSVLGGRVYLGAWCDRAGRVREWLELWVQVGSGLNGSIAARENAFTNTSMDLRWKEMVAALTAADPNACWETGWECVHPVPAWLDDDRGIAIHATDGNAGVYELCTDDSALVAVGLEPFSESLHRFLYVKGSPASGFVAVTADAPRPLHIRSVAEVLPREGLVPFNPEGGYLFVRRLAPLELRQYAQVLSGRPFPGLSAGSPPVKLGGAFGSLDDWDRAQQGGQYIFSQRNGRSGRFLETLHLKLQLFAALIRTVRAAVAKQQLPLLGLSSDSFRVGFAAPAADLPVLWTAQVALVDGGNAISLPVPEGSNRLFRQVGAPTSSVFRAAKQSTTRVGRGELRVRSVRREAGSVIVEGTIVASDLSASSVTDLIRLRVPLPAGPAVELWGTIHVEDGLVHGEARFRATHLDLGGDACAALERAAGLVLPGTPFETLPVLSSPCDLFSLGVIGVQLFLASGGEGLAIPLDETLSLARALDQANSSAGSQAIALAGTDSRWVRSLGPQCHGHQPLTAEEAFSFVPLELWWDIVGLIARLFPGAGPMSYRRDLGDAPPHRLEAVFDEPLGDVEKIIFRSQSVLLGDWMANREVARVVQRLR